MSFCENHYHAYRCFYRPRNYRFAFFFGKSKDIFMKILNNDGYNIDPCGTAFIRHTKICMRNCFCALYSMF